MVARIEWAVFGVRVGRTTPKDGEVIMRAMAKSDVNPERLNELHLRPAIGPNLATVIKQGDDAFTYRAGTISESGGDYFPTSEQTRKKEKITENPIFMHPRFLPFVSKKTVWEPPKTK